ncbi:MAG: FkbM family methyltransferase [Chthoniobacterales bacterium]|nr:FkbM family methyltransferase [Chthoniobacterales bacterium]
MERAIHTFDNGVRVYEDQLWAGQRARYEKRNVHEAEEEDIFVDLIARLSPEGCYVDVGAAIGYYLILARKLAPRLTIHGIEPLERHRRLLRENLLLNDLAETDFTIHPEGLNSSEGSQAFQDRGYSSKLAPAGEEQTVSLSRRWKAFLESIGLRRPKNATITIPTITLDTLVRRIGDPIDLLQMDVQGLEVEVLKGASESLRTGAIRTFLIGTHGRMVGLTLHQECRQLLQTNGYAIEVDQPDTKEQPDGILVASKRL